jgi:hypothetical protein
VVAGQLDVPNAVQAADLLDRELLLKESEWAWSEMEDFVRQVQRYRLSYATALFASLGWILGQLVDPTNQSLTLDAVRARGDIAGVILLVPMLNGLFFLLMMEAAMQVQSLARYRFLLGCALGKGAPVWRWEVFKLTPEGSIRPWTTPSNIFLAVLVLILTAGTFWFVQPSAASSREVAIFAWLSGTYTAALIVSIGVAGLKRRTQNDVADGIGEFSYASLLEEWRKQPGSHPAPPSAVPQLQHATSTASTLTASSHPNETTPPVTVTDGETNRQRRGRRAIASRPPR